MTSPKEKQIPPPAGSVLSDLLTTARDTFAQVGVSSLPSAGVLAAMKDLSSLRSAVKAFDASLRIRSNELQPTPAPTPFPEPVPPESSTPPIPDSGPPTDVSPSTLDHFSGLTTKQGRAQDRHARVLEQMPALAAALAAGRIADGHVGVLAEILFSATDQVWAGLVREHDDLAEAASKMNPTPFRRYVNQATHRIAAETNSSITRDLESEISASLWIDPDTGLGRLTATFDPMSYAKIAKTVERLAGKITHKHRTITRKQATGRALIQLLTTTTKTGGIKTGGSGSIGQPANSETSDRCDIPTVAMSVIIDQRTLVHGAHANTICEHSDGSRIPVHIAQQLACNATLTPIITDPSGIVLNVGRSHRYATPHQRQALEAMYATCAITECETPVTQCHGHHITYWEQGGPTDLNNLLPLCEHHHRWIHSNNPTITLDQHRILTVTMPNGTTTTHHPNRQPNPPDGNDGDEDDDDDDENYGQDHRADSR